MSFTLLPKEIRLHIWSFVYSTEPPRLVALKTREHNENHDTTIFCPRYVQTSPVPTIVNVCHEARAEAYHQAQKAGHLVKLPYGSPSDPIERFTEFIFRFDTDILYLPLEDADSKHADDSPDNGLLAHFRAAVNCDPSRLRNIAVTKVVWSSYHDGSLSNTLGEFPYITYIIMIVPIEARDNPMKKDMFVRSARRITSLYKFDIAQRAGDLEKDVYVNVDFATINKGRLDIISKGKWQNWSDCGIDWLYRGGSSNLHEVLSS